jgi:hypothetical protein
MAREWLLLVPCVVLPGCSLLLDFSKSEIPKDAAIDAVYTQDECDYKEPNDSVATAAVITAADTGPAAICVPAGGGEDDDYYRFTVPAATTTVTVQIMFTDRPGGDLDLKLYKADGTFLVQSRGFGPSETIKCPNTSPPCTTLAAGDYVFEVIPGAVGNVNDYTFSVTTQ